MANPALTYAGPRDLDGLSVTDYTRAGMMLQGVRVVDWAPVPNPLQKYTELTGAGSVSVTLAAPSSADSQVPFEICLSTTDAETVVTLQDSVASPVVLDKFPIGSADGRKTFTTKGGWQGATAGSQLQVSQTGTGTLRVWCNYLELPGPAWTPAVLGMNWAAFVPGVNLWQDSGGGATTPAVAAGDPVGRIALAGPDNIVLVAANDAARGTLTQSNGVWYVTPNGTSTRLQASGYRPATATVVCATAGGGVGRLWAFDLQRSVFNSTGGDFGFYNDNAVHAVNLGLTAVAPGILTVRIQSGSPFLARLNGANGAVAVSPAAAVAADFQLFSDDANEWGSWPISGIAVGSPVLGDTPCLAVEQFIEAKTGMALGF